MQRRTLPMAGADCRSPWLNRPPSHRPRYDFAIFGTSPLSALLAGLLAHDHGKQVLRIADPVSPQRLPRALDLALPLATRPASWRLLRRSEAETRNLLTALDAPDTLAPTTVKLIADLPATGAALAHLSHVALGFGLRSRDGNFSGISRLNGEISLADSKVVTVERDAAKLSFTRTGAAELTISGELAEIGQIVLADDAAILDLLPEAQRPPHLAVQSMTATLTTEARRLPAPVMRYLDRGVTLSQRQDLSILALVSGDADLAARLGSTIPGPFPLRRLATTHYRRLITTDGAPLLGRLKPSKLFVIAGLGDAGLFLAPPIARLLAGKASADEKPWFSAHDPARPSREAVAEFVAESRP